MLYNSFEFIFVFLPITLLLYFGLARLGWNTLATVSLVVMSLVFYSFWDWTAIFILLSSILGNYAMGLVLKRRPARWVLGLAVTINVIALGYYKYTDFFISSLNDVLGAEIPLTHIVLPLGISFFTFTQIAFLVDTFNGRANDLNFWRYLLFVTFFPHLIAGPIVHHREIMGQFARPGSKRWIPENINAGILLFTMGLVKKVIIADTVSPWANAAFDSPIKLDFFQAWGGALSYTMQLYFDFSGYTDMAIGLALLFNVRMPDNFHSPYKAISIVDFWQRWHITLSRFLRDYLYIPLGGNRKGPGRRYMNLLLTMLLGGLWHGAGWTYVIWGAYHGTLLALTHAWKQFGRPLPLVLARPVTFVLVMVGWVFFRAMDVPRALSILRSMFDFTSIRVDHISADATSVQVAALIGLLTFVNFAPTSMEYLESRPMRARHAVTAATLFFVCLLCMRTNFLSRGESMFIYFQF